MQPQLLLDSRPSPGCYRGAAALRSEGEKPEEDGSVGGREREHALRLGLVPRLEENGDQGTLRAGNAEDGALRVAGVVQAHPGAQRRRELGRYHAGIVSVTDSS